MSRQAVPQQAVSQQAVSQQAVSQQAVPRLAVSRLAVIGGGISGLAAARRLAAICPRSQVLLLEASGELGGKLRRVEVGGAWVDVGAEAMLARRPEAVAEVIDCGLGADLIHPMTSEALIRNRGRNRPLPGRTLMGLPADLGAVRAADVLSAQSLARIEAEPALGPYPPLADDVSVGHLVTGRFGSEVTRRLVDPLLGGIYAGHADAISMQAALPALATRLMSVGGSLLEAVRASVSGVVPGPVFVSIKGGLGRLPRTIAAAGGFEARTRATVRELHRTSDGFRLVLGSSHQSEVILADAVVIATPAAKSAQLLSRIAPAAATELAEIDSASMAIVTLAFAGQPPVGLPPGSGLLVPDIEGLAVKAMTFSSQKWPGVGDESGVTLMRGSFGRAGEAWTLHREDSELVAVMHRELAAITGIARDPVDTHVQRWGGALPQYAVGHVACIRRIRTAIAQVPGLAVCGASYDGVGIAACIASAHLAADRVMAYLSEAGQ